VTDFDSSHILDRTTARPAPALSTIATATLGGFGLGVIARAWMRLIAEEPEFTVAGTVFVVLAFTIFGLTQSIAAIARQRALRRRTLTVARIAGVIGFVPLFIGAGALMLPTVVGGGLALWRIDWGRVPRGLCALVGLGPVVLVGSQLVGSFGYSLRALIGFLGLLAIYGTIIVSTRFTLEPQADGWRLQRRIKVPIFVALGLLMTYALVGIGD
jgi:hypothetical protein